MSTDRTDRTLARLYRALGDDAGRAALAPPAAVRAGADRRAASRAGLAVAAVTVLAAVAGFAGYELLGGGPVDVVPAPAPTTTVATPAPSTAGSASVPPTTGPGSARPAVSSGSVPTPTGTADDTGPTRVPDSAFVGQEQLRGNDDGSVAGRPARPQLCGLELGPQRPLVQRGTVVPYVLHPSRNETPTTILTQDIARYRTAEEAATVLAALRQAVRDCPTDTVSRPPLVIRYRLLERPAAGDEALLIERREPGYDRYGDLDRSLTNTFYSAAIRSGDAVTMLDTALYEDFSVDREEFTALLPVAAERLRAWRAGR